MLNYREDFDFTTNQPVAANYYPIQSALVMRNSDGMQVTMTNDRSQGCSTIDDSKMEIMINRRLLGHDSGGMTEPLNEMNASGEGIQVNTHFRMQIFDHSKTESLQRHMQRLQDEPI